MTNFMQRQVTRNENWLQVETTQGTEFEYRSVQARNAGRGESMSESVCIEDFCGRIAGTSLQTSFSADYFPGESLTYFTGDWGEDIPPMPCPKEPTKDEAYAWARKHGGVW